MREWKRNFIIEFKKIVNKVKKENYERYLNIFD